MVDDSVIGSHPVRRRGDVMMMRLRGPLTSDDVIGMRDLVREMRADNGHCFLIADVSELTGISADARRSMAEWGRSSPVDRASGVVIHGAAFVTRTLITLTFNAVRLLGYAEVELKFMPDELVSMRWVDEQRAALARMPA